MEIGIQWPLVLFTVIAGSGFGLTMMTGIARIVAKQDKSLRQIALVAAFILMVVGGLMSVFHLSHPERFMAAIANLFSFSGIALELIGLILGCAAVALFFVLSTAENEMGEKVLAVCCVVIGVVAALLQGFAYFEVGAQAGWHMVPLPLSYLLTSLAAGAAIYLALAAVKGAEAEAQVLTGKIVMALAALGAVAAIAYVGNLAAAGLLEGGALTAGAVTVAVAVVAFALGAWFAFKSQTTGLAVGAAVLCVGASLAVRVLMWVVAEVDLNLIAEAAANRGLFLF